MFKDDPKVFNCKAAKVCVGENNAPAHKECKVF